MNQHILKDKSFFRKGDANSTRLIRQVEESLHEQWLEKSIKHGDGDNLAMDGLLRRGDIYYEDGAWHRYEGDEVQRWLESDRRLLILTKDLNDTEAWNIQEETGRRNVPSFDYSKTSPFYKNLRMWAYGLLNIDENGKCPPYSVASNMNISGPFYETAPIARMNVKKQCGGGSISDNVLEEYIRRYAEDIYMQINQYDANIIMCCGCKNDVNPILNFVRNVCLRDLEYVEGTGGWIFYSKLARKVVINCYHPSNRIGYEKCYCGLTAAFEEFINQIGNTWICVELAHS